MVMEAPGGLQTELASALVAGGLPVAVVTPPQVRDYAKACNRDSGKHQGGRVI
jgi:transposase